jgi:hypothetical protein
MRCSVKITLKIKDFTAFPEMLYPSRIRSEPPASQAPVKRMPSGLIDSGNVQEASLRVSGIKEQA